MAPGRGVYPPGRYSEPPHPLGLQAAFVTFLDHGADEVDGFAAVARGAGNFQLYEEVLREAFSVRRHAGFLIAQCHELLRPGGLVAFSAFGPDTLCELRESWSRIDSRPHVHRFPDMHDLGDGLVRAGCAAYTTAGEVDRLIEGVRELIG